MRPIPETAQVVATLDGERAPGSGAILDQLLELGDAITALVPDAVAISVQHPSPELTLTLVARSGFRVIRRSVRIPVHDGDRQTGMVEVYAGRATALRDVSALVEMLGARADDVAFDVDLGFASRARAEQAPQVLDDRGWCIRASALLQKALGATPRAAARRLQQTSLLADVSEACAARVLVQALDPSAAPW